MHNAPPDNTDFCALDLPLRLVHVCNSLSEVELGILLCGDSLDLYQRSVGAGVAFGPLVA